MKSISVGWVEHVTCMREKRNAYKILVGMPEGKGSIRRSRRIYEDNIKTNLD
jgi:hypothetical protein